MLIIALIRLSVNVHQAAEKQSKGHRANGKCENEETPRQPEFLLEAWCQLVCPGVTVSQAAMVASYKNKCKCYTNKHEWKKLPA